MKGSATVLAPPERQDTGSAPRIDDYCEWALEQADHLRSGRFECLDLANVIDEIEAVGRSEVASFRSNLRITLTHLLKWDHQPTKRSRSWENSIGEHRDRISEDLKSSPSLAARRNEIVGDAYELARRKASRETRLPITTFPERCPYTWSQIMDAPYELDEN